ncbi:glycosyltransferase family 2 protein [Flavobacterium flavipallidum]|uniref:Glycosyltransferase family A protein n=1 Tax=Flavobacterium flavipallidum TaxID=3139140 RepID=A0ABU9HJ67_9FLAO
MLIFIYHNNAKIVHVENQIGVSLDYNGKVTIAEGISLLAQKHKEDKIVWCHLNCKAFLNKAELETICHHDKLMLSYCPADFNYINRGIGYVDESLFVNVNKKVSYPTWQMSGSVGIIHASVLVNIGDKIPFDLDFDYYLNSLAKLAMPLGLLCYSEPKLLKGTKIEPVCKTSNFILFRFVKQHYKKRWVFLLLLNLIIYERQLALLPFLWSFGFKKRNPDFCLEAIKVESSKKVVSNKTVDVIIPTIGRKPYLYDVLKDLARQTLLPEKVIIVEQNPIPESVSELDYLETEFWPFKIERVFTHQAGACHARNLALTKVTSEWVFLADDDIRFENIFFEKAFTNIDKFAITAISMNCLQKNEENILSLVFQWSSFGSGCSIVAKRVLKLCHFNLSLEFGYGEDVDFGMQLRNLGQDVLFLPEPKILHLKAPVGGFRTKAVLKWQNDLIPPKPSPTVMLSHILHKTKEQNLGYKTILFLKYYKHQKIKNPIRYLLYFRKQWKQSVFWATQLNSES